VARGFQYYDLDEEHPNRTSDEVTARALEWIDGGDGRPFLLFLHYWDPHEPYSPPPPYDTEFDPSYEGKIGNSVILRSIVMSGMAQVGFKVSEESGEIDERDLEHVIALYDGEIAFADSMIGELLRGLEKRGLFDNTVIVLHSDHGEEFFEHGGVGHGHAFYNEVIRVALTMTFPGVIPTGTRVKDQVRLLDVTPTILDLLGLTPDPGFEGVSLVPLTDGTRSVSGSDRSLFPPQVAYSEGIRVGQEKKAITAYPWKLIHELESGQSELFNLMEDFTEQENLVDEHHDVARDLEKQLAGALFELSDQWYVEVSGGNSPHRFDVSVSSKDGAGGSWMCPFRGGGSGQAISEEVFDSEPGCVFEVRGLETSEPVTLGLRIHSPRGGRPRMESSIDGEPANTRTFVGENLENPRTMPFDLPRRKAKAGSARGPVDRPDPPYILVWRVEGRYGDHTPANLSEDVKKELRALGYIQ
jgi:hypothetical protein